MLPKLATEGNPVFVNTLDNSLAAAVGLYASNNEGDHFGVAQTHQWLKDGLRRCTNCIKSNKKCIRDCSDCESKQVCSS